jgi:hypothetical protein
MKMSSFFSDFLLYFREFLSASVHIVMCFSGAWVTGGFGVCFAGSRELRKCNAAADNNCCYPI